MKKILRPVVNKSIYKYIPRGLRVWMLRDDIDKNNADEWVSSAYNNAFSIFRGFFGEPINYNHVLMTCTKSHLPMKELDRMNDFQTIVNGLGFRVIFNTDGEYLFVLMVPGDIITNYLIDKTNGDKPDIKLIKSEISLTRNV